MDYDVGHSEPSHTLNGDLGQGSGEKKSKSKSRVADANAASKRRCVSTACIACRKRKSRCDGQLPKCAACASVYLTECEYAPHTDQRRKGVYKKDIDGLKTKNTTLQVLIQAILNAEEEDVADLVRQIRTCDNLEDLANAIESGEHAATATLPESPVSALQPTEVPQFDAELSGKMGDLWLDGSVKFVGGTSNLIWMTDNLEHRTVGASPSSSFSGIVKPKEEAIISWTTVTQDKDLVLHFINMYFCWHYAYFTTLSKELFYRDFLTGTSSQYCSSLLVNVMLALGCHFSNKPAAKADPDDSSTTGDHYFQEAKRLLYEDDEFANAKLCTVQALALMSVREAGCGRESKGWVYSGMSFRMASDLGLNIDAQPMNENSRLSDEDIDARRVTFWGCFLFDKCWSNYLGRQPQLQLSNSTVKKPDVFPTEDSERWSPYTDSGIVQANAQPARTRTVALQLSKLAEISGDLLASFYHPNLADKPINKQNELKKLSDIHTRLETWKKELPAELDVRDAQLPQVLLMHMFYQLLYIHLYRPFLRYTKQTSPLPSHVSPRKFCTQAAGAISKLFRLYKRTHGLRQICNIAIYILHTACTIHILNLPDKNARRDIVHGGKHLEEMGDCWTAARRTLEILRVCAEKWKIDIPEDADATFARAKMKWGLGVTAPSSPGTGNLGQIMNRLGNQAVPDQLANNIPMQLPQHLQGAQPQQRTFQQSMPFNPQTTLAQVHMGLSAGMAPSPADTIDTRRSSGNMSLPPQNAMDFNRGGNKVRPSTHLTKAQQDAWNIHQARLVASSGSNSTTTNQAESTPASRLFGGVDSLMEDSQDWWYKDQSQLAMGFDNWGEPTQDWYGMDTGSQQTYNTPEATNGGQQVLDSGYNGNAIDNTAMMYAQQYAANNNGGATANRLSNGSLGNSIPRSGAGNAATRYQRMNYDDESFY